MDTEGIFQSRESQIQALQVHSPIQTPSLRAHTDPRLRTQDLNSGKPKVIAPVRAPKPHTPVPQQTPEEERFVQGEASGRCALLSNGSSLELGMLVP
jgi:hypothetical protein